MPVEQIDWELETIQLQPEASYPLVIRSRFNKKFLRPREGYATGTTIRFRGRLYELHQKETIGKTTCYRYALLDQGELVRNLYDYTEENHLLFVRQHKLESTASVRIARGGSRFIWYLRMPVMGLCPLDTQYRFSYRSGIRVNRVSMAGAFLTLVIGFILLGLVMLLNAFLLVLTGSLLILLLFLCIPIYWLATSLGRIVLAFVSQEPSEPTLIAGIIRLVRARRGAGDIEPNM